jgi:hypothetical protein
MQYRYTPLTKDQAAREGDLLNLDASLFLEPGTPTYDRALDGLIPLFKAYQLWPADPTRSEC